MCLRVCRWKGGWVDMDILRVLPPRTALPCTHPPIHLTTVLQQVLEKHHPNVLTAAEQTHWFIVFLGHMAGGFSLLLWVRDAALCVHVCLCV